MDVNLAKNRGAILSHKVVEVVQLEKAFATCEATSQRIAEGDSFALVGAFYIEILK